jgi:hypothetical protein
VHDKETYTYRLSRFHDAQELPIGQTHLPYDMTKVERFGLSQMDPIADTSTYTIERKDITGGQGTDLGSVYFQRDTKFRLTLGVADPPDRTKFQVSNSDVDEDYFLLPIEPTIRPEVILSKEDRRLFVGVNFEYYPGFLVFKEDPGVLFEDSSMTVQTGWQFRNYALDFQGSYEYPHFKRHWVLEYLRQRQDLGAFKRAIASVAGLLVLPESGHLEKVVAGSVMTYLFDWGPMSVNYPHTPLTEGYYEEGFIVGSCVVSYGKGDWAELMDWSAGISLQDLGSQYDVVIPNEQRGCWLESGNHIRIELDGPDQDDFWNRRHSDEDLTGVYLNDVLGLAPGERNSLNPMDFMLENFLGDYLVRVDLSGYHELQREASVRNFILENKPVGIYTLLYTS